MTRKLVGLWIAGALGGLAQTLAGVAVTLMVSGMSSSNGVVGLPQTMQVLGTAVAAPLIARASARWGRGVALGCGGLVGAGGCAVLVAAAASASVPMALAGSCATGAGAASVALARYAAVDAGPDPTPDPTPDAGPDASRPDAARPDAARPDAARADAARADAARADAARAGTVRAGTEGRALASVLAAVAVGAVAGPNLLAPAASVEGFPEYALAFVVAAVAFGAAAAVWSLVAGATPTRPPAAVRGGRELAPSIVLLGVANLVMVGTMTMAPVQLHHLGAGLGVVGAVVGVHIGAMFAPAPLSGWLVDRFGVGGGAVAASVTLLAATSLAALSADSPVLLTVAIGLLGLGWSAAVVTGSAALVRSATAAARPRAEAVGEIAMGLAAAVGGAASGVLVGLGGYPAPAAVAAVCVVGLLIPIALRVSTTATPPV
ncbi:MFS transporter [Cryptosporangium sp. NPDC051539]|uniref:MFS transporter n=1 Tax=Cryptosporangium sp. NPDC051539 TaxID=3363962 RepID=UPI00379726C3